MRLRKLWGTVWLGLGYMLSPLSWWNDLFFNLPIAYGFAYGVSWLFPNWFLPATALGYWLSNVLGILLMQWGAADLLFSDRPVNWKKDLLLGLISSTAYTLLVLGLMYTRVLSLPTFLTFS